MRQRSPLRERILLVFRIAYKKEKTLVIAIICAMVTNRLLRAAAAAAAVGIAVAHTRAIFHSFIRLYNFPVPFISFNRWKCLKLLSNVEKNAKRLAHTKCK